MYPGRQPLALQLSPKLRSSLPILPEQPSAAAQGAPLAMPSAASPPLEAEPPAQPAHSLPMAPHTAVPRRETRQPGPEALHLKLSASMPAQQTTLAVDSSAPGMTQQQQQQQQDAPLGVIEVPSAEGAGTNDLFEGERMHERSASGQEQGLAMAERVIDAYGLGMKPPSAPGEDPAASDEQFLWHLKLLTPVLRCMLPSTVRHNMHADPCCHLHPSDACRGLSVSDGGNKLGDAAKFQVP